MRMFSNSSPLVAALALTARARVSTAAMATARRAFSGRRMVFLFISFIFTRTSFFASPEARSREKVSRYSLSSIIRLPPPSVWFSIALWPA